VSVNELLKVIIDELRLVIVDVNDELNTPIELLKLFVVFVIDELTDPIELDKDEVSLSKLLSLPLADDVNSFSNKVVDSIEPILVFKEELNELKSIPSIVPVNSIEPDTTISLANTTGVPLTED
jgi:hypothetical protein